MKKYLRVLIITFILLLIIISYTFWGRFDLAVFDKGTNVKYPKVNEADISLNWEKWEGSFKKINATLQTDVYCIVKDMFKKKKSLGLMKRIEKVNLKAINTNFSNDKGDKQDYLITVDIKTDWLEDNAKILLVFIHQEGKYKLTYQYLHSYTGKGIHISLKDIDSDTAQEVVIEEDNSGNQSTANFLRILKYDDSDFRTIFEEGLSECYGFFPYRYENSYKFEKNKDNPRLFDIVFSISTIIDRGMMAANKDNREDNIKLPEPFKDEIIFTFNGKKYMPGKEVYDYRKNIRLFLKE